jgi:hypothetical protein
MSTRQPQQVRHPRIVEPNHREMSRWLDSPHEITDNYGRQLLPVDLTGDVSRAGPGHED